MGLTSTLEICPAAIHIHAPSLQLGGDAIRDLANSYLLGAGKRSLSGIENNLLGTTVKSRARIVEVKVEMLFQIRYISFLNFG